MREKERKGGRKREEASEGERERKRVREKEEGREKERPRNVIFIQYIHLSLVFSLLTYT